MTIKTTKITYHITCSDRPTFNLDRCFLDRINPCMPSCCTDDKKQNTFTWKKNWIKHPPWQHICLVSPKAFKINNKRLAKAEHAQVCRLCPSPQSRQPIALFLLLWWSVVLNSWHISPHILTSKIAFCQYEGKDSFGFNDVRQLMSSINRTMKNNQNVTIGFVCLMVFLCASMSERQAWCKLLESLSVS